MQNSKSLQRSKEIDKDLLNQRNQYFIENDEYEESLKIPLKRGNSARTIKKFNTEVIPCNVCQP